MAAIVGTKWSNKKSDNRVAFGSVVERKLFPVHSNPTRMGIEQGLRGEPHRGPGCYDDDPLNLFLQPMNLRPRSIRGYGFGATHSKRTPTRLQSSDPGPADYQATTLAETKPAYRPFESAATRFKNPAGTWDHLGPGSHDQDITTNRRIAFDESFGGPKVLRQTIVTKCTKGIQDKCDTCGEPPIGNYYQNIENILCRNCFKASGEGVALGLRDLKKVRDCTSIHRHEFPGRTPKTMIMSEKDQKKLKYREAYMSLYYS